MDSDKKIRPISRIKRQFYSYPNLKTPKPIPTILVTLLLLGTTLQKVAGRYVGKTNFLSSIPFFILLLFHETFVKNNTKLYERWKNILVKPEENKAKKAPSEIISPNVM